MAGYYSGSSAAGSDVSASNVSSDEQALAGLDDVERLEVGFEQMQRLHSEELKALQETDGKLLDKRIYIAKRKAISDAYKAASQAILQSREALLEETRKKLAENLLFSGGTETEKQLWFDAVRLVEDAKDDQALEELAHRAKRWGNKELARAICRQHCGVPERKELHRFLADIDPAVSKTFEFEMKHGAYRKKPKQFWIGWLTG
ncbi:MAG TPA: hypothetical protein PLG04_05230 [Anaerolineaceae bacterium]|nr:hypothetical protein [Anaerolineaceae bacterium]